MTTRRNGKRGGLMALVVALVLAWSLAARAQAPASAPAPAPAPAREGGAVVAPVAPSVAPIAKFGPPTVKLVQYLEADRSDGRSAEYRNALPSLLRELREKTTLNIDPDPVTINSFADPQLFQYPFIYVNYAMRARWEFSPEERDALRHYLERGGFIFVDAGITAEFLRGQTGRGQSHSYAEWEATPELQTAFASVLPGATFKPLKRNHPLYQSFYQGLPDTTALAPNVQKYVTEEKWPQGTYSAVAITVKGRIAVLATPIIAMGWGRDQLGNWSTHIGFRIREGAAGLPDYLKTASYGGERYAAKREDAGKDIIYCQEPGMPAWVQEPDGNWRIFRYQYSREISDFAHSYFTQLGVNIVVFALTQ